MTEFRNRLNLSTMSPPNKELYEEMVDFYETPSTGVLYRFSLKLNILSVRQDMLIFLSQIKEVVDSLNLTNRVELVNRINRCLVEGDETKVIKYITQVVSFDMPNVGSALAPRIVELCNIYRTFKILNNMPGHDGKSVNIFKLPGLI
jgi:hypothetical protein